MKKEVNTQSTWKKKFEMQLAFSDFLIYETLVHRRQT